LLGDIIPPPSSYSNPWGGMMDYSHQEESDFENNTSFDLSFILSLEEERKTHRRGSFLSTDVVPKRTVVEDNRIVDFLRSQRFTIGTLKGKDL
jgi:hypothetical protein